MRFGEVTYTWLQCIYEHIYLDSVIILMQLESNKYVQSVDHMFAQNGP